MESDGVWKALSPDQSVIHIDIEYIEADCQNLREAFPNHPLYSNGIALDVSQLVFVTAPTDDVFCLYNPNSGEHLYTIDENEKEYLAGAGWKDEGIACYSAAWSAEPVYRACNPNVITGVDHFMTSEEEYIALAALGWKPEEIAWLGMPSIPL